MLNQAKQPKHNFMNTDTQISGLTNRKPTINDFYLATYQP